MPHSLASHLNPPSAAIVAFKDHGEVHPDLRCIITHEALVGPVRVGHEGLHLYSEDAIVQWAQRNPVDPMTRRSLRGQVLIREPVATAAVNALRRGAADLCLEEGDGPRAIALSREAAACEAVDAQRPVAKLPSRTSLRCTSARSAHTVARWIMGISATAGLGVGAYVSWQGYDLEFTVQTGFAGSMANALVLALNRPPTMQVTSLAAAYLSTAALRWVTPTTAHLWGIAIGTAATYW